MTENNKYIDEEDFAKTLNCSTATIRNWVKLNKILPSFFDSGKAYFSYEYANDYIEKIRDGKISTLNVRRNKTKITGNRIYKKYVTESIETVCEFEEICKNNSCSFSKQEVELLLSEYAARLYLSKQSDEHKNILCSRFICKEVNFAQLEPLFFDLASLDSAEEAEKKLLPFLNINIKYFNGEDLLGFFYMSLLSMSDKKESGSYFTPENVAKKLLSYADINKKNALILDPCCGTGAFFLALNKKYSNPNFFYGFDIDDTAVKVARINIALAFEPDNIDFLYNNFICANFLEKHIPLKFDAVIGNPPWGSTVSNTDNEIYTKLFKTAKPKGTEIFSLFIEKAISLLSENGKISFVIPESFLNVKAHTNIRKFVSDNINIVSVCYLNYAFYDVSCKSIAICFAKNPLKKSCTVEYNNKIHEVIYLRTESYNNYNFKLSNDEYSVLNKIKSTDNCTYLKQNADFYLGIVTGDNNKFICEREVKGAEPIIKGKDIEAFCIRQPKNFIVFDKSKFQQCVDEKCFRAEEKIIYKFISDVPVFAYDNQKILTLNSCNFFVPKISGLSIKYIIGILNSDVVRFFLVKSFDSVKLLKSHIESIPIPKADVQTQRKIEETVNAVLKKKRYESVDKKQLNSIVNNLYLLNNDEKNIIYGKNV